MLSPGTLRSTQQQRSPQQFLGGMACSRWHCCLPCASLSRSLIAPSSGLCSDSCCCLGNVQRPTSCLLWLPALSEGNHWVSGLPMNSACKWRHTSEGC